MAPLTKASPAAMPERAAHEAEILHRDGHRDVFDPAEPDLEGVLLAGLGAGILEAVQ